MSGAALSRNARLCPRQQVSDSLPTHCLCGALGALGALGVQFVASVAGVASRTPDTGKRRARLDKAAKL